MSAHRKPDTYYQIEIKGQLSEDWVDWFEGMAVTHPDPGITVLTGPVADQSQLHGILSTIGMLNVTLISVTQIDVKSNPKSLTELDGDAQ